MFEYPSCIHTTTEASLLVYSGDSTCGTYAPHPHNCTVEESSLRHHPSISNNSRVSYKRVFYHGLGFFALRIFSVVDRRCVPLWIESCVIMVLKEYIQDVRK